jgi:hypothetical protein
MSNHCTWHPVRCEDCNNCLEADQLAKQLSKLDQMVNRAQVTAIVGMQTDLARYVRRSRLQDRSDDLLTAFAVCSNRSVAQMSQSNVVRLS